MSVGVRPSSCLVVTKRQKIGAQPPSHTSTVSHREFYVSFISYFRLLVSGNFVTLVV